MATTRVKTLLIGLDGGTWTVLRPLMQRGVMPFLHEFVERGVQAPLRSVIPALTPPGWTSLMTGKRPGQHGVFDFFRRESPDSEFFRFAVSGDIGADTIWSIASRGGQRIIALNYPLMFPPPAVNGSVVPGGWIPWRQLRLGCYPPGLFDRLKTLPSFNAREMALDMALEEKAIEGCAAEEYAEWIELHIRRDRRWFDILDYLMTEESAELTAIMFDGVDKLQHLCWRFIDPACQPANPTEWEAAIISKCESYFRQLDGLLQRAVERAGSEARTIIGSDHGAGPTSDIFYVNTWLEQQGYLGWAADGPAASGNLPRLGMSQFARHNQTLDWTRTTAYAATPSSNGIFLVRKSPDKPAGVSAENHAVLRDEIARGLRQLRHPVTGAPVVTEVWTRDEAFAGPHAELGPDLTVTLFDGGLVSILRADAPVKPRPETVGTHRALGVFMAAGPGIRRGAKLDELSIQDVAPLVLHSLGLPVPSDLAARLPAQVLEDAALKAQPMQLAAATATYTPTNGTDHAGFDEEAETLMLQRLRALGYIE
jgi:predicted AlkP superfamily phosphohydrolase/phosphomutase